MVLNAELEAATLRTEAGFQADEVPGAVEFASACPGVSSILLVAPDEVWGLGEATADGVILIRNDLEPTVRDFVIFHECAEIWVKRRGFRHDHFLAKERDCDAIAAALLAPAAAFVDAVEDLGPDNFAALAFEFSSTQTAMALRVGEVIALPVRVERPGLSRVRGAPVSSWERARRVEITDAADRWALVAA